MPIRLDPDLLLFLCTVIIILVTARRRLGRSLKPIPAQYEFEEVSPGAMTEGQARFLVAYDTRLDPLGFYPTATYRVTNFGHNLMRSYSCAGESSRCVVIVVEVLTSAKTVGQGCTLEFITKFTDGTTLTTRSMKLKSLMDQPPYRVVQECPNVNAPPELKRRHDARAGQLGSPVPPASDARSIFEEIQSEHDRFMAFQVERGVLQRLPQGVYALTDKTLWRGIRNFLNPFAHRFRVIRLVPAALAGVAIPIYGMVRLAPLAAVQAGASGFSPQAASGIVLAACYIVAGALVGILLERNIFVWAFLLTFVGVHAVIGWEIQPFPFSMLAGLAAFFAAQTVKRRRLILLRQSDA